MSAAQLVNFILLSRIKHAVKKVPMIKLRTMKHVASSRTIPSFRSCRNITQVNQGLILDQGRMMLGYAQVLTNDAHRKWRNGVWQVRR